VAATLSNVGVCAVEVLGDRYGVFSTEGTYFADGTNSAAAAKRFYEDLLSRKLTFVTPNYREGWGNLGVKAAELRSIEAGTHFGAAVDACLLVCTMSPGGRSKDCRTFAKIEDKQRSGEIGYRDGQLIADVPMYTKWKHLAGEERYKWRSGIKHDCSKVMELRKEANGYRNGLGELVELEGEFIHPMLKSSEVANGHIDDPVRWMLVTQRTVGEDTAEIALRAPKTWAYLLKNGHALDKRGSSIYRKRPRFSVFGVGGYSFTPWKVAISGFYKRLKFTPVGPSGGKSVVFDDTVYFVACQSDREAKYICSLLNSDIAKQFYSAFIFWDAKRPITVELLRRLDLLALAHELGSEEILLGYLGHRSAPGGFIAVS
jgi:hypothetical protein